MRSAVVTFVVVASFTACALDFSMGHELEDASVDGGGDEHGGSDVDAGEEIVLDASWDGSPFSDPGRWEVFDLRAVPVAAGGVGEVSPRGAAVFDGRGLWVFPMRADTGSDASTAYRYEVDGGDFKDASSWSTIKTQAAASAAYCAHDGHIYLASYVSTDPVVRYRAASFPKKDFLQVIEGGSPYRGFSGTSCFPKTGFYAAAADPNGDSFYYEGSDAEARSLPGQYYRGVAHYEDSTGEDHFFFVPPAASRLISVFSDARSWNADAGIAPTALGVQDSATFEGAIDDGNFLYLVPGYVPDGASPKGYIYRFRESEPIAKASSWEESVLPSRSRAHGGVFDGRFVYFAPGETSNFVVYDTDASFGDTASWNEIDLKRVDAGFLHRGDAGPSYRGAAFDGRYVYFIPVNEPVIIRYRTDGKGMPSTHTGSFY